MAAVYVTASVVVMDPKPTEATECPTCGFDAVLTFPTFLISASGVGPFADVAACARCYSESEG